MTKSTKERIDRRRILQTASVSVLSSLYPAAASAEEDVTLGEPANRVGFIDIAVRFDGEFPRLDRGYNDHWIPYVTSDKGIFVQKPMVSSIRKILKSENVVVSGQDGEIEAIPKKFFGEKREIIPIELGRYLTTAQTYSARKEVQMPELNIVSMNAESVRAEISGASVPSQIMQKTIEPGESVVVELEEVSVKIGNQNSETRRVKATPKINIQNYGELKVYEPETTKPAPDLSNDALYPIGSTSKVRKEDSV